MLSEFKFVQKLYRIENYELVEYEIIKTRNIGIDIRNIKTGVVIEINIKTLAISIENSLKGFTISKIVGLTILAEKLRKMSNQAEVELEEHRYELWDRMHKYDREKYSKNKTIGDL